MRSSSIARCAWRTGRVSTQRTVSNPNTPTAPEMKGGRSSRWRLRYAARMRSRTSSGGPPVACREASSPSARTLDPRARTVRNGRRPRKEYRPTRSPCSTLSSRNACALRAARRWKAATGVHQSAMSSRTTGTTVDSRDSFRKASRLGCRSARLIPRPPGAGRIDPGCGRTSGAAVRWLVRPGTPRRRRSVRRPAGPASPRSSARSRRASR